jgi:hypothetical protein
MPAFSNPEISKDPQLLLCAVDETWREEWQGMPEFVSEEQKPHTTILVHFKSWDDVKKFAEVIGQKINAETRYMWFPKAELKRVASFRYVNES